MCIRDRPRMAYYMEYSTRIYQVYLKYIAPEDIVVYSIDEVFMDCLLYTSIKDLSDSVPDNLPLLCPSRRR